MAAGAERRAKMQKAMLVRGGALGLVVLLVGFGLLGAAKDPNRARLQLEAAGAIGVDEMDPAGVIDTTTTTQPVTTTADPSAPVTAITTTTTTTTAPADSAVTPTDAVAVGDSVMLGASGALQKVMPGIRVDAKVARQFDDLSAAATWYATSGNMPGPADRSGRQQRCCERGCHREDGGIARRPSSGARQREGGTAVGVDHERSHGQGREAPRQRGARRLVCDSRVRIPTGSLPTVPICRSRRPTRLCPGDCGCAVSGDGSPTTFAT